MRKLELHRAKYPLSQNCFISNIIYKAVLASNNPHCKEKSYFDKAEATLKFPHSNHQRPFKFLKYKTDIELSSEVWWIKKSGQEPVITWEIVQKCSSYSPNSKKWCLCLNEKLEIVTYQGNMLLNNKQDWYDNANTKTSSQLYCKKLL